MYTILLWLKLGIVQTLFFIELKLELFFVLELFELELELESDTCTNKQKGLSNIIFIEASNFKKIKVIG